MIGDTPFAFDFEPGRWPETYRESIFVPLHGVAGTWMGAKVVAVAINRSTGLPKPASNLNGAPSGAMSDFATGWDDGTRSHGRPGSHQLRARRPHVRRQRQQRRHLLGRAARFGALKERRLAETSLASESRRDPCRPAGRVAAHRALLSQRSQLY
ncbi:MAG: hypothetical protein QM756_06230 [Polyangiaceae bacterium]